jgi:pimeloyl-ACP methyl ester carboxylesterase
MAAPHPGRTPAGTAYWVTDGDPDVVFAHGLGEDHRAWTTQQAALAPTWRTCAYDVRGHGRTPVGAGAGTLEQLGDDLVELLETLGRRPRVLVGFSLGGTIVLRVAATRPELARGVVVFGTSSVVGPRARAAYLDRCAVVTDHAAFATALETDLRAGLHRTGVDVAALLKGSLEAIGDAAGYCNAARAMARLHDLPLTPQLIDVRCSVLVVGAEHDRFCPPKAQQLLLESLPHGRRIEVPGVGHLMNVEDPGAVTRVLQAFLADEPPRARTP